MFWYSRCPYIYRLRFRCKFCCFNSICFEDIFCILIQTSLMFFSSLWSNWLYVNIGSDYDSTPIMWQAISLINVDQFPWFRMASQWASRQIFKCRTRLCEFSHDLAHRYFNKIVEPNPYWFVLYGNIVIILLTFLYFCCRSIHVLVRYFR